MDAVYRSPLRSNLAPNALCNPESPLKFPQLRDPRRVRHGLGEFLGHLMLNALMLLS